MLLSVFVVVGVVKVFFCCCGCGCSPVVVVVVVVVVLIVVIAITFITKPHVLRTTFVVRARRTRSSFTPSWR